MKRYALILLFLVACAGEAEITEDAHVGSSGVKAEYIRPTEFVLPGERVGFLIEVSNDGTSESSGAYTIASDPLVLQLQDPTTGRFKLKGRTTFTPIGEKKVLSFKGRVSELAKREQTAEASVRFNMCYDYQTDATVSVCVDTRPEVDDEKVCVPGPVSAGGGQGAPVGVELVEMKLLPGDIEGVFVPRFTISVANLDQGVVLAQGIRNPCQGKGTLKEDFGRVGVRATLSNVPLQCKPFKFNAGAPGLNNVVCTLPEGVPDQPAYLAHLTTTLTYGYFDTIVQSITVQK